MNGLERPPAWSRSSTSLPTFAYYIDSGANAEQREALRNLLASPGFAPLGQPAEVKEIAIKFENLDGFGQVGKTTSATVGEIAKVEVTPIAGNTDPNKPMVVENGAGTDRLLVQGPKIPSGILSMSVSTA